LICIPFIMDEQTHHQCSSHRRRFMRRSIASGLRSRRF
jgi:hypothetical protein